MQSFFEPTPPAPLTESFGLEHYTLESPLAAILMLLALAGLCWVFVRPARRRAGSLAAVGLGLSALSLAAAAHFIDTPRERVQHALVGLVDAIATGDTRRADALLAPAAAIYDFEGASPITKVAILDRVRTDFGPGGKYELSDHAVLEAQIALNSPTLATTQIKVRVSSKVWGGVYISWWRMDLARDAAGAWRVSGIQPVALPGHGGM